MKTYVLSFNEINKANLMVVGGKAMNLGSLSRINGLQVPEGFSITTEAYKRITGELPGFGTLLKELASLKADDRRRVVEISRKIRNAIEGAKIPRDIEEEVFHYITEYGENNPYAVRSSATAEDLPTASFAGQQDTYLNIIGKEAILLHIKRCWASLFTDRAVMYRIQNGFDHRHVYLSVVIQRMIFPQSSGIMFTADPVTCNRRILSIDASFGLGEAIVSGLVNADIYKVREGKIIDKKVSAKKIAIYPLKEGGTKEVEIDPERQNIQTLTDEQILSLEAMGRLIQGHFGCPQDIEWGISEGKIYILQSRPITTLYPIPKNDGKLRVYVSLGHQQMMTEDIKPLGMSFLNFLSFWFGKNMEAAGGRLYLDITHDLASPIYRRIFKSSMGKADVLAENALDGLIKRPGFIKSLPRGKGAINVGNGGINWIMKAIKIYQENDIDFINNLIVHNEELIQDLRKRIEKVSGDELFEFILDDTKEIEKTQSDPNLMGVMVVWGYVSSWISKKVEKWLGEKNVVDTLSKSVSNNVTSNMGLELLDVSDIVRQYPEVIEYLHHTQDKIFFEDLAKLEGGEIVSTSIKAYLEKYGMRCPGEIDITKTRWSEKPTALIPMILSNIKNSEPNSRISRFNQGIKEAAEMEQEILSRLQRLPRGKRKAKKAQKMISVLRNVTGFREYPKFALIKRFQIYKDALMNEAALLEEKGIIKEKEDVYYLSFEEFRDVANTNVLDYSIIKERKEEYQIYEKLTPPRVITSEGEIPSARYNSGNTPQGALVGIPVSSGIIEGRARVVLNLEDARIDEGDILVTEFTDPSWTPLFISVKGLVTEIGGLMTHGAVITREYGIPGVVGVENATKLIKDGQRIRVNGTDGYIEILE